MHIPPNIPDSVKSALQVFTDEERGNLVAVWQGLTTDSMEFFTGKEVFIGIRYFDRVTGANMKFTDERRATAMLEIEDYYRVEAEGLVEAKRKRPWSGRRLRIEPPVRERKR